MNEKHAHRYDTERADWWCDSCQTVTDFCTNVTERYDGEWAPCSGCGASMNAPCAPWCSVDGYDSTTPEGLARDDAYSAVEAMFYSTADGERTILTDAEIAAYFTAATVDPVNRYRAAWLAAFAHQLTALTEAEADAR